MSLVIVVKEALFKSFWKYIYCFYLQCLLPEASFGLRVLSLPACVRVSVIHELVCAITRHKFELKSPNLDKKMQNILLKVPIVLGTDWAWPSMSNFTLLKKYVYLYRFCIFEIFVRHVWLTAPHPTWLRTHCLTTTCPPTGSRNRLKLSSCISWWDHRSFSQPRLGDWHSILQILVGFWHTVHTSHAESLYANIRQSSKQQ